MSGLEIHSLTVSLFQSNCFILGKAGQREVIVVDPGDNAGEILAAIKREDRQPVLYLLTHGHVDHVYALSEVVSALPAPVAMHPAEAAWAFTDRAAFPPYYGPPAPPPQGITRDLADGQVWTDAGLTYTVLETPGHSPGGVCFYFETEDILVSGDCLFQGAIGRTDLPGGDARVLSSSLDRIMRLPDQTVVYAGHGPATTIGRERKTNPFLLDRSWAG